MLALLLGLWSLLPVHTPLLPAGEWDPWRFPWWNVTEDTPEHLKPLFDVPWRLMGEALPVVPEFQALSPLWVQPGALWRLEGLTLPDSLPEPTTHLFSRRGTLEYTHLGGVFARSLGRAMVLLGADFREHRWRGYPLRREGYGITLRGGLWTLGYRKFTGQALASSWNLDLKRLTVASSWGTLTLVGFHLPVSANFYRARWDARTWSAEVEGCRGRGLGRLVYRVPPPVDFLHLTVGFAGTGARWFPEVQLAITGPGYRWTAGYWVWSRVDSLRRYRTWPRAYLQIQGQTPRLEGWAEVAYSRDLEVRATSSPRRLDRALTGAAYLRMLGHLGPVEVSGQGGVAAYVARQDTLLQWSVRPAVGLPLRGYQQQLGFRPWTAVVLTDPRWRWDLGMDLDLFRVVQGEVRVENLALSSGPLRRYTLLLAVVFPD